MNKQFWFLTITVFVVLLIPSLVQEGMFLDGITYSAISNNLANGIGSIWCPSYTKTMYISFYEHPPLVFIIQSWFFKIFGSAFYTERIYSFFIALMTLIGIVKCWRLFFSRENDWLPILLWLFVPLISWAYKNNILENTMGVFTIFSIFFITKSLIKKRILYLFLGSSLIVLAFLSKGFVGIFPIIVPIIYAIVYKNDKITILYFGYSIFLITASIIVSLYVFPELNKNLIHYFNQQLFPALNNQREITTNNRFSILLNLISELLLPIIILLLFAIKDWKKQKINSLIQYKVALFWFLIAISASIPLVLTLKQRTFYTLPSIPFYILSISTLLNPYINSIKEKITPKKSRLIKNSSIFVLSCAILYSILKYGDYSRDKEMIKDIYLISKVIPKGTIMKTSNELCEQWSLIAYLVPLRKLTTY